MLHFRRPSSLYLNSKAKMNMMGMDMSGNASGIADLPLNDPRCIAAGDDCLAFWAAHNASQATTPWAGQFEYVCRLAIQNEHYGLTLRRDTILHTTTPASYSSSRSSP